MAMNMNACYSMWECTRGAHDDMHKALMKYIIGSNLWPSFLEQKSSIYEIPFSIF